MKDGAVRHQTSEARSQTSTFSLQNRTYPITDAVMLSEAKHLCLFPLLGRFRFESEILLPRLRDQNDIWEMASSAPTL